MELDRTAIFCIHKNFITYINKTLKHQFHIEHFYDLAKKDFKVAEKLSLLGNYENTSDSYSYYRKLIKSLVRDGIIIILNTRPDLIQKTDTFCAFLPEKVTDFQKSILHNLSFHQHFEFYDFGIYDSLKDSFTSFMQEDDYDRFNFYLLDRYLRYIDSSSRNTKMVLKQFK